MKKRLLFLITFSVTMLPTLALAAGDCAQGICNPLNPSFSSVPRFIEGVLQVMVKVGLPVVAFFFLYSGYLFVSAGGNSEKLSNARSNFVYVVIGAVLILGAWVIATLIGNTVSQVVG